MMDRLALQPQTDNLTEVQTSKGVNRVALAMIFLICGVLVFVFASNFFSIFPTNKNLIFEGGLGAVFLAAALFFRRSARLQPYWQLAYAFFIATFVFFFTTLLAGFKDETVSFLGLSVSSSAGFALDKVVSVLLAVMSMLVLTHFSGVRLDAIYLQRGALRLGLGLGSGALVFFTCSAFLFNTGRYTTPDKLIAAAGWGLVFSLANGFMEELWFRGLFLKRLEPLVGSLGSILLTSVWFSLSHCGAVYLTPVAIPFILGNTFVLGLACAWAARKTDSLLAPTLIHAASDLYLFMAMLASI
jgi:membrane protease YdiL (CAAX protease family)